MDGCLWQCFETTFCVRTARSRANGLTARLQIFSRRRYWTEDHINHYSLSEFGSGIMQRRTNEIPNRRPVLKCTKINSEQINNKLYKYVRLKRSRVSAGTEPIFPEAQCNKSSSGTRFWLLTESALVLFCYTSAPLKAIFIINKTYVLIVNTGCRRVCRLPIWLAIK